MSRMPELTFRQRAFVLELHLDPKKNATHAALKVGCPKKSAHVTASKWLKKDKVKAYMDALGSKQEKRFEMKADEVLRELHGIVTVDPIEAYDDDGTLKPLKNIPARVRKAMSGIEVDEIFEGSGNDREKVGETKKVKFWNKVESAKLLGQNLKLWMDKIGDEREISVEAALDMVAKKIAFRVKG